MELKKSPKADVGRNKLLFVEIGLIVTLSVTLLAFNYTTDSVKKSTLEDKAKAELMEEIMITEPEDNTPEPEVETQVEELLAWSDEIDVVDDDIIVENIVMDDFDAEITYTGTYDFVEVEEEEVEEEAIPYQLMDDKDKPSFNGGDANEFSKWVNQRLVYPEVAKENGIQGRVILQFTVEKDGTLDKIKVLRSVDPALDKEAMRVVAQSPKWKPGRQRDRTVPVTYTFPVIFQLR